MGIKIFIQLRPLGVLGKPTAPPPPVNPSKARPRYEAKTFPKLSLPLKSPASKDVPELIKVGTSNPPGPKRVVTTPVDKI